MADDERVWDRGTGGDESAFSESDQDDHDLQGENTTHEEQDDWNPSSEAPLGRTLGQWQKQIENLRRKHGWTAIDNASVSGAWERFKEIERSVQHNETFHTLDAGVRQSQTSPNGSGPDSTHGRSWGVLSYRRGCAVQMDGQDTSKESPADRVYPLYSLKDTLADSLASKAGRLARKHAGEDLSGLGDWKAATDACIDEVYALPLENMLNRPSIRRYSEERDREQWYETVGTHIRCSIRPEYDPASRSLRYALKTTERPGAFIHPRPGEAVFVQVYRGMSHCIGSAGPSTRDSVQGRSVESGWVRPKRTAKAGTQSGSSSNLQGIRRWQSGPTIEDFTDYKRDPGPLVHNEEELAKLVGCYHSEMGAGPFHGRYQTLEL